MNVPGVILSPADFGLGLAKGSWSLLDNTFAAVFGASSKLVTSMGKGFALLSFDDDFASANQVRFKYFHLTFSS